MDTQKRKRKGKGKWSPEARERYRQMMINKYGYDRPLAPPNPKPIIEEQYLQEGKSEEDLMKSEKFIAKRRFDYDTGLTFEHGEVVELRNLPNDKKLVGLGYLLPYTVSGNESDCIHCGKIFGSTSGYTIHVASHFEKCTLCGKNIPPEEQTRHFDAHAELAKI